jgi:hypothetical protein
MVFFGVIVRWLLSGEDSWRCKFRPVAGRAIDIAVSPYSHMPELIFSLHDKTVPDVDGELRDAHPSGHPPARLIVF